MSVNFLYYCSLLFRHYHVISHVMFYRQCHSWLEEVNTTSSQQSATSPAVIDKHFVSGVHLGVGVFNVVRGVFVIITI